MQTEIHLELFSGNIPVQVATECCVCARVKWQNMEKNNVANSHVDILDSRDFELHLLHSSNRDSVASSRKQQNLFLKLGRHRQNNVPEESVRYSNKK